MSEAHARRDLVRYSKQMFDAGWVANHDGNLSVRVDDDRIVCTPTALSKRDVTLDDLVVANLAGKRVAGARQVFSELALHCAVYATRKCAKAVVHTHAPYATAFGAAGQAVPHPFLPEAVVSLGAEIPLVPLTAPGAAAVEALKPFLRRCNALLIAGNGVLAWGPDLETAYLRAELVEHVCKLAHLAAPLGGVKRLSSDLVAKLVERRVAAGLGAPDEGKCSSCEASAPNKAAPSAAEADTAIRAARLAVAAMPNVNPAIAEQIALEIARNLA